MAQYSTSQTDKGAVRWPIMAGSRTCQTRVMNSYILNFPFYLAVYPNVDSKVPWLDLWTRPPAPEEN